MCVLVDPGQAGEVGHYRRGLTAPMRHQAQRLQHTRHYSRLTLNQGQRHRQRQRQILKFMIL